MLEEFRVRFQTRSTKCQQIVDIQSDLYNNRIDPICLTSHASVPGSNTADPARGFQRNILLSQCNYR